MTSPPPSLDLGDWLRDAATTLFPPRPLLEMDPDFFTDVPQAVVVSAPTHTAAIIAGLGICAAVLLVMLRVYIEEGLEMLRDRRRLRREGAIRPMAGADGG